jgi:subtilisin family serine protease
MRITDHTFRGPVVRTALFAVTLALHVSLLGSFAVAQVGPHPHPQTDTTGPAAIDPTLGFLAEIIASEGVDAPILGVRTGRSRQINPEGTGALLRFKRPLTEQESLDLEAAGVRFLTYRDKKPVPMGSTYRVFLTWPSLSILETHPLLMRAEATWKPLPMAPTEVTAVQVGAEVARRLPELELQGEGVLIGSIDSGVDVLHPAFFQADGGLYDWIDVNGNGRFEPGIDAVDLNGNGRADRNEVLRVLQARVVTSFDGLDVEPRESTFHPRRDWLYADMNDDGERNAGRNAGFFEDDPAYGEPIFVVDDVNGNGILDVGEKLVRLRTSKIRKYYEGERVYERGVDLIEVAESEHRSGFAHGTAAAGILIAGQPFYHERIGLAPGADLVVYGFGFYMDWEATIESYYLEQAAADGVDILLHEWTNPIMRPLDGSTNLEAVMDHLFAETGMIHVNPVGNLNRSRKHVIATGVPGQALSLTFQVGPGHGPGDSLLPYTAVFASVQWRGEHPPRMILQPPQGEPVVLDPRVQGMQPIDGGWARLLLERTSRQTHLATLYLSTASNDDSLPAGRWTLVLDELVEEETFIGRITDAYTLWSGGVSWEEPTEGLTTLSYPASADSAFGVTAFSGRRHPEGPAGPLIASLRDYAGRGPRIDGYPSIRLAAPDDPVTVLAATPRLVELGGQSGWYVTFGGTSGAAPHVAAALALLRQHDPRASAGELLNRLETSADRADLTPSPIQDFPDPQWGWGRLDVLAALGMARDLREVMEGPRAELMVRVDDEAVHFDASHSLSPQGQRLTYRFDVDYDGRWDADWNEQASFSVTRASFSPGPGMQYGRVEVRDERGLRAGALVSFVLANPGEEPDAGEIVDADSGSRPPDTDGASQPGCLCATTRAPLPTPSLSGILFLTGCMVLRRGRRGNGEVPRRCSTKT